MSKERKLWQAVLHKALLDATHSNNGRGTSEQSRASRDARNWIDGNGRDFRMVCSLAGIEPDCVRDAYQAGRISYEVLRSREVASENDCKGA